MKLVDEHQRVRLSKEKADCRDRTKWAWRTEVVEKMVGNSSIVLIAAVLASLGAGVLLAYGVCLAMFRLFRFHVRQVAAGSGRRVVVKAQVVQG